MRHTDKNTTDGNPFYAINEQISFKLQYNTETDHMI